MKIKRTLSWAALAAIMSLVILSIIGAFIGSERATDFFYSVPLVVYWCFCILITVAGFFAFTKLRTRPGLLVIHLGCILVILGSLWACPKGHKLASMLTGKNKIDEGYMVIFKGQKDNRVFAGDFKTVLGTLPYEIALDDFRLDYYESEQSPILYIQTQTRQVYALSAKEGSEFIFDRGILTVTKTYSNFKLQNIDGKQIATDTPDSNDNPTVEVNITLKDGTSYSRYAFEKIPEIKMGTGSEKDGLKLQYVSSIPGMVRDYFSDLVIIENEKETFTKTIEVNHPMHYKGYHIYQDSYDAENGSYTVLAVTSDSGLYAVYAGYILLCCGVIWQLWITKLTKHISISNGASA